MPRALLLASILFGAVSAPAQTIHAWLTTPDRTSLVAEQPGTLRFAPAPGAPAAAGDTVELDPAQAYQSIDGFGFALTGGSAQLMMRMSAPARAALIQELFGKGKGSIGVSYLRVSIGASDMNDHVYSYDDMPAGQTDPTLAHFSLGPDLQDVVPVLQQILKVRPDLPILGSPWSAPAWMKTNEAVKGGTLRPELYPTYAEYLARYVEAMRAQGIRVAALTLQNEPENPKNTPSMTLTADEEGSLLKAVGPLFRTRGLAVQFVLFDHNCDHPQYPLAILADPAAAQYAAGSGFHLYEGEVSAMTQVHDAHPDKNIYFTEQMTIDRKGATSLNIAEPVERVVIGATRNWSRNVLLWNLAADPQLGPHTPDGGCPVCEGAITLDGDQVTRNLAYYTVAQVAKFVPAGSVRIRSGDAEGQVAFLTPAGAVVLLLANTADGPRSMTVRYKGLAAAVTLPAGAAETLVWQR
jgi:glucosylceramidase